MRLNTPRIMSGKSAIYAIQGQLVIILVETFSQFADTSVVLFGPFWQQ